MRNRANAAVLTRGVRARERQNLCMRSADGCRGFTLIELCCCLAVLATLAAVALPGMRSGLRAAAVRGATFELLAGLQQARTASIVQARPVVFCLSDAGGHCLANAGTAAAWSAFVDGAGTSLAGGELPAGVELRATRPRLTFWPDSLAASTGTLTICDAQRVARPRALVLSQTGRVRLTDAAAADCLA